MRQTCAPIWPIPCAIYTNDQTSECDHHYICLSEAIRSLPKTNQTCEFGENLFSAVSWTSSATDLLVLWAPCLEKTRNRRLMNLWLE